MGLFVYNHIHRARPCNKCGRNLVRGEIGIMTSIKNNYRVLHIDCVKEVLKEADDIRNKK